MRGRNYTIGAVLALVTLAGASGLLIDADARGSWRSVNDYRPSAATPRARGTELYLPRVFSVLDYDLVDDHLYLLDPRAPVVHRVRLHADSYEYLGAFGRRGGGPGEFTNPTGVAVVRDPERIAVIEPGRIHFFNPDGEYRESVAPDLPCLMPLARIAGAARGIFAHGDCVRRAVGGDTVMAMLAWSPDGREFRQVVTDPR